ncbi:MAG: phytoene/squalene synthase family protein [Phycisphaerae bacterium]|nr:phytoene/squalene synthase family protein [Gemmatimonadaceae bacterium]
MKSYGPTADTASIDARYCERVVRDHARTFALASRLLPAHKRRAAYALYAFCRLADDLVDLAPADRRTITLAQLDAYRGQLDLALKGQGTGPVFREVARVVHEFDIPGEPLHELLAGVARDLENVHYANWEDLQSYCEGVASSVGEMCTHVFGVRGDERVRQQAVRHARTLGVAMQLTNILRDVGEDAERGRCYLPDTDLSLFGLTREEILHDPRVALDERWRHLMIFEVARARSLYRVAAPGISLLERDAQSCATACATGYAGILKAIEGQNYNTIASRARLGNFARVGILWDAWRFRAPATLAGATEGTGLFWEERPSGPPGKYASP